MVLKFRFQTVNFNRKLLKSWKHAAGKYLTVIFWCARKFKFFQNLVDSVMCVIESLLFIQSVQERPLLCLICTNSSTNGLLKVFLFEGGVMNFFNHFNEGSPLAEAPFPLYSLSWRAARKGISAMGRNSLLFNRRPWSWTAVSETHAPCIVCWPWLEPTVSRAFLYSYSAVI